MTVPGPEGPGSGVGSGRCEGGDKEVSPRQHLSREARLREALFHWEASAQLEPGLAAAHLALGNALAADAPPAETIRRLQQIVRGANDFPDARMSLASLLVECHRTTEGLEEYRQLLRLNPQAVGPLNSLAWILATDPDPKVRNGREAVPFAERAVHAANPASLPEALDTLGAAYAEAGRFPEAVTSVEKAIALAQAAGQTNSLADFRGRLNQYQLGRPFHEPGETAR